MLHGVRNFPFSHFQQTTVFCASLRVGFFFILPLPRSLPIVLSFSGYGVIVLVDVFEVHKTATRLIVGVPMWLATNPAFC